jgi:uncharacterized membrane protein (DUF2068 family)
LKRWAEWFTVVITSSLLPIEIYELLHHSTPIKFLILIVNIAVVVYLLHRIIGERHHLAPNRKITPVASTLRGR